VSAFSLALLLVARFTIAAQSIEGDVYLRTVRGETNKFSATPVALVPADSAIAMINRICRTAESDSLSLLMNATRGLPDKATQQAIARWSSIMWARVDSVSRALAALAMRRTRTGMAAHYRIDSIPPGRYMVWAEVQLVDRRMAWAVETAPVQGQQLQVDLDNLNVINGALYCERPVERKGTR
jgi:hypothetical protein